MTTTTLEGKKVHLNFCAADNDAVVRAMHHELAIVRIKFKYDEPVRAKRLENLRRECRRVHKILLPKTGSDTVATAVPVVQVLEGDLRNESSTTNT